jgi:hypothetical protein
MMRFAGSRAASALLLAGGLVVAHGGRLSAQEIQRATLADAVVMLPAPTLAAPVLQTPALPPRITSEAAGSRARRPGALVPLYVSFSTMQVLDTHSTWRALNGGAVEANPLVRGVAQSRIGMLSLKAAGTAGILYASEKMWKKNKAGSIALMIAANSAMGWVVQHNYRVVR